MPSQFAEMGIRFQYPDNWSLAKETASADCRSVTVNSPGSAFWTLSIHPRSTAPDGLVEAALKAMQEEYKDLETETIREEIDGREIVGKTFHFYCLDLVNAASVRCLQTDRATYVMFCQAEDREFDRMADVFRAMTTSFVTNLRQWNDPN